MAANTIVENLQEINDGISGGISIENSPTPLNVNLQVENISVDSTHPLPVDIKNATIEITTTVADIVTIEQSDKTKNVISKII